LHPNRKLAEESRNAILPLIMRWTGVWPALSLSLPLILMVVEAPVLHQHRGDAPAFYDEACPLSQLCASRSEVPAPKPIDLTQPLPAIGLAVLRWLPAGVAISALPFEPRGPPFLA
jgi:hypothetical protein